MTRKKKRGYSLDLGEVEDDFLASVSMGNLANTKAILNNAEDPKYLLNLHDFKDRDALEIATENEHCDIVEFIFNVHGHHLSRHQIHESLMLAISKGYLSITQILLSHPSNQSTKDRARLGSMTTYYERHLSSKFDRDVTPLMLAATCNEVDITRILLDRGDTIEKPHHPLCDCNMCKNRKDFDPLMHSLAVVHTYQALASEAYISLTSPDPILTAFLLSDELNRLALTEKEFKNEYRELEKKVKQYASDLVDMCQTTDEVKTILKQEAETLEEVYAGQHHEATGENALPRLVVAIKYRQKQFVAHPNCQHHLSTLWYQGFPGWRQMGYIKRIIVFSLVLPLLPFACIAYFVYPKGRFGEFMRSPIVKFMTHAATYMAFLVLLFLESVLAEQLKRNSASQETFFQKHQNCTAIDDLSGKGDKTPSIRPEGMNPVEVWILIFVIGMAWGEIKQLWQEGCKHYLASFWNWIDIAMLNLLTAALVIIILVGEKVKAAKTYFDNGESCQALEAGNTTAETHLYFLRGNRKQWDDSDPILVSEILFALANVLSFSRLSFILPISEFLGPLQISLGRMLGDIIRFGAVFGVVFLAFFCALSNLYWYYPAATAFGDIARSFMTLAWALFGLGERDDPNCPADADFCKENLTNTFGIILYACYHAVMVVVMLNMLIAMMSTSYDEINNDEDVEWKFARAKLWMSYFEEGATLPLPFNIVPSPKSWYYFFRWISDTLHQHFSWGPMRESQQNNENGNVSCNAPERVSSHIDIMKSVVKRYLFQLKRDKETDEVDGSEIDEIKNDISSFRFDLIDMIDNLPQRRQTDSDRLPTFAEVEAQIESEKTGETDVETSAKRLETKVDSLTNQMEAFQREVMDNLIQMTNRK